MGETERWGAMTDSTATLATGEPEPTADLDHVGLAAVRENVDVLSHLRDMRGELTRFMLSYKFAMDEITTKIQILREEFTYAHDYNPIEHVTSRLKRPESILEKARRRGWTESIDSVRDNIQDIAGVRVTCAFVSDVYRVFDMLTTQRDVTVLEVEDYIAKPKPNGYRSLHAIVEVPVYLSDGPVDVRVELQMRTIAMDFWASLEHKTYYKYDRQVPGELTEGLRAAAETAAQLDSDMEQLHRRVHEA